MAPRFSLLLGLNLFHMAGIYHRSCTYLVTVDPHAFLHQTVIRFLLDSLRYLLIHIILVVYWDVLVSLGRCQILVLNRLIVVINFYVASSDEFVEAIRNSLMFGRRGIYHERHVGSGNLEQTVIFLTRIYDVAINYLVHYSIQLAWIFSPFGYWVLRRLLLILNLPGQHRVLGDMHELRLIF